MKSELNRSLPVVIVFITISLFWVIKSYPWYLFLFLALGSVFGVLILLTDHLVYWLYTHPQLEESRLAQATLAKRDYRSTIKLLLSTKYLHTDLIFHHVIFQLILIIISIYAFTSADSVIGKSFLLGLNVQLLTDQYLDWRKNPSQLQKWLFARLPKQIPINYLKPWLITLTVFNIIFIYLLAISY